MTKPDLVNVDFADVRTITEGGGVAMIGLGESRMGDGDHSIRSALRPPLSDGEFEGANAALVNVVVGPDTTIGGPKGSSRGSTTGSTPTPGSSGAHQSTRPSRRK